LAGYDVTGKVALITGGARGIGLETARALHRRGARVALVDLDGKETEAAAASIGDGAIALATDVTDEGAVALTVDAIEAQLGGIDIVVANAGIAQSIRPNSSVDPKDFDRVLDVNLHGVVYTVRQALPQVIERRGHVLVIASVYAFVNGAMQTSYAMSKAAVEQYGRALRVELAQHGASAGVGYFGFVDTAMVQGALEDPIAGIIEDRSPRFLRKRISPVEAGEALADGITRRAARTIRPRRWSLWFRARGLVNPALDEILCRDDTIHAGIAAGERAEEGVKVPS
jgi:NAD(P)-dependent dehydrogenase (short-subunit alcohol dehydrogenase family)